MFESVGGVLRGITPFVLGILANGRTVVLFEYIQTLRTFQWWPGKLSFRGSQAFPWWMRSTVFLFQINTSVLFGSGPSFDSFVATIHLSCLHGEYTRCLQAVILTVAQCWSGYQTLHLKQATWRTLAATCFGATTCGKNYLTSDIIWHVTRLSSVHSTDVQHVMRRGPHGHLPGENPGLDVGEWIIAPRGVCLNWLINFYMLFQHY